jgi:hypothetical protein
LKYLQGFLEYSFLKVIKDKLSDFYEWWWSSENQCKNLEFFFFFITNFFIDFENLFYFCNLKINEFLYVNIFSEFLWEFKDFNFRYFFFFFKRYYFLETYLFNKVLDKILLTFFEEDRSVKKKKDLERLAKKENDLGIFTFFFFSKKRRFFFSYLFFWIYFFFDKVNFIYFLCFWFFWIRISFFLI